jgi:CheY-like chemotaxis protein
MANVLVVDDELDVLEALGRALRIGGYTVSIAANSADALKLCADHSFDVVVLDYIMPSMSGIELLNRIRKYQPTIRSVIVSGKLDAQVSEESVSVELRDRIEADAYLHKPVDNPKLLETVKSVLSKDEKRSWTEVAERNLNAEKRNADVKETERSLRRIRRPKNL